MDLFTKITGNTDIFVTYLLICVSNYGHAII